MGPSVEVVGAVIVRDGLILCAQRGAHVGLAGKWEFPGGKIEPCETHAQALEREITEELGCTIEVGKYITSTTHTSESGAIILHTYVCHIVAGEPEAIEHALIAWVAPGELKGLDWAPADLATVERVSFNS